ncbi:hypothetical protein SAMN05192540_0114 [Maribacter dokdonensis]|uniref:Lipoprotein n=1 Tax=Maribacter dokdonensis TaxID=320912 RepID=A0A1H4J4L4_9FLAO|nr:hypothetical protein [Maribacter dokdonensis]SEB41005.1 hypothetical protein SAMN05192540_0114 [Maribacter dokdonensis]
MKKGILLVLGFSALLFSFLQCKPKPGLIVKNHQEDPFKNTITSSQYFKIDTKNDTVISGENGTTIVFQKGSFLDSDNNIVTDDVEIELTEALTIDEMILSNLTTISDGKLLETDGMIYFNATAKGKQLFVNPEKPVYVEIPTANRKSGMSVYKGLRDKNGNMNWVNPIPIENYLIPLDLFTLDFLPDGFVETLEKEMPFLNHQKVNEKFVDSLYYSLYFKTGNEIIEETVPDINVSESYYDKVNETELDSTHYSEFDNSVNYGVDPAAIKAIKNNQFQNTLIATKQFEERLKLMFKICRSDIIDIYTHNLDKNLWELDSIAASLLDENIYQEDFKKFASQKWTTVKVPNKNLLLLKSYYEKRLQLVKNELKEQRNKAVKANNEKTKKAKELVNNYKTLLNKREAYRMTGYGFELNDTGWINIDRGTMSKDWEYSPLEFLVTNENTFDRVYGYVMYTSIKSLYRLKTNDSKTFYVGNETQREMIMPKDEKAIGILIAYKNDQTFLAVINFQTNTESLLKSNLQEYSEREIKKTLAQFETSKKENSILEDLEYLDEIYLEEIRQNKLLREQYVMSQLWSVSRAIDTSYMEFDKTYGIDLLIETCLNNVRN